MATNYLNFFSQFQSLIDSINHDSDASQKLTNLQNLYKDGLTILRKSRDEAAYDLRFRYNGEDAEQITGISRKSVDYWAKRHMRKHSLPRLKNKRSVDLATVINLNIKFPKRNRTTDRI